MRLPLIVALMLALPAVASAQATRTELIEQQRAEKAARLAPYQPGRIEKLLLDAEEGRLRRLIAPHNGFYAEYGYTYKPLASGIGFGGGFRHDLFNRNARVVLEGGGTFKQYAMVRGAFDLPRLARGRLALGAEAIYRRHTQDDFYGVGDDSLVENRTSYGYRDREVQGRATVAVTRWLTVGGRAGWLSPTVVSGSDSRYPSTEELFDNMTAPGVDEQPEYTYSEGFTEVDYRDEPGNARAGGRYVFSVRHSSDRDFGRYDFRSTQLLLQQFVPVFDKKRVFALQLALAATTADPGQQVPFYYQPTLGGSRTLRSEADYRFRDRNAVWFNGEYRWEALSFLDMALFTDWGRVAPRLSDLSVASLEHAFGIGFRFKSPQAVFFRTDIAAGGSDGVHFFFKFGKAF